MTRRNPQAKWALPETVNPETRKCTTIEVPDDPQHIAAFRGALLALASAYNWQDDVAHTARDVALVWRAIIDDMTEWGCSMLDDVRQNDELPCVLEKHLSGEWQPFANLRYCPPNLRIAGGVIQYFDEGTQTWVDYPTNTGGSAPGSQPGSQPAGDEPVPAGECKSIMLTVQGNGITIVPFRVLPGDTVYIDELTGGWTHDIGSWPAIGWYCGTGKAFVLGACGNTDGPDGDLLDTLPVGRLICQYGSNFFDAQPEPYSLSDAWTEDLLALRMNDSEYGDNAGSVTCRVTVCNPMINWCYAFDWATLEGWTLTQGTLGTNILDGTMTNGYRIDTDSCCAWGTDIILERTISVPVWDMTMEFDWSINWAGGTDSGRGFRVKFGAYNGSSIGEYANGSHHTNLNTIEHGDGATGTLQIIIGYGYSGSAYGEPPTCTLGELIIRGTGFENPFGEDNCT